MRLSCAFLVLSAADIIAGEDRVFPRATKPFCKTITSLVTSAHQQSAATAFCSSYLHIPGSNSTSTTIRTTVTTVNGGAQATVTVTSTSTVQIAPSCTGPAGGSKIKRDKNKGESRPKPGCFSKYTASAVLSSACRCLSIPPGTTTTVVTSISTSTSTIGGGTSTTTATATTTVAGAVSTPNNFRVYVSTGSSAAGRHLLQDFSTSGQGQGAFVVQPGDVFQLNSNGQLVSSGNIAYQHDPSVSDIEIVYFNGALNIQSENGIIAIAVGDAFGCALSCTQGSNSINTLGNNAGQIVWQLESAPASGEPFTPMVEAAQ